MEKGSLISRCPLGLLRGGIPAVSLFRRRLAVVCVLNRLVFRPRMGRVSPATFLITDSAQYR